MACRRSSVRARYAPPPRLSTPSSPATRWRFCFPCKWRKSRSLRRLPVAPAGAAETAWRAVLAAHSPAISALVSVAEVRSPRVYEVFMPGGFSAYKRVSFCAARACRRSLFGHFEADAQVTKFIVHGELPALFRITGRPRLETNSSRKHKRRRPGLFGHGSVLSADSAD